MATYKRISTHQEACKIIRQIDELLDNGHYADPVPHPESGEALIKFKPEYLGAAVKLLEEHQTVSLEEAVKLGWYIGPFKGRFAKARAKLEEAQHLYYTLSIPELSDNRPVFRALFFAYLATLYAICETVEKVCERQGGDHRNWWQEKKQQLKQKGNLLNYFITIGNRDKHNHESYFNYKADVYSINIPTQLPIGYPPGQYPVEISAEGMFAMIAQGTKDFKRAPLGLGTGIYSTELIGAPEYHLGNPIGSKTPTYLCHIALGYFEELVFEAEELE